MFSRISVLAVPLSALLLAACSSTGSMHGSASTPVKATDGSLVGPNGHTLYTFSKDAVGSGSSACYGQCATNWPPLPVAESVLANAATQPLRMPSMAPTACSSS